MINHKCLFGDRGNSRNEEKGKPSSTEINLYLNKFFKSNFNFLTSNN